LFVPGGSVLIEGDLPPVPGEWLLSGEPEPGIWAIEAGEAGMTLFSGLFILPTQASVELQLKYQLPAEVINVGCDGRIVYRLQLIK